MSVSTRPDRGLKHLLAAFVVALSLAVGVTAIGGASASAVTASAAAGDRELIAKSPVGKAFSKVVGKTATGDAVTGSFTPTKFVKQGGKLWVKGFLEGVITDDAGTKTLFSGIEKMQVKKINGQSATGARVASLNNMAACQILRLVLGPLDLDLLGLRIHLDRVVLTIVAQPGPGNLLGNLLCAIAGLLDPGGTLTNLLTQLRNLLNQILAALNLGV